MVDTVVMLEMTSASGDEHDPPSSLHTQFKSITAVRVSIVIIVLLMLYSHHHNVDLFALKTLKVTLLGYRFFESLSVGDRAPRTEDRDSDNDDGDDDEENDDEDNDGDAEHVGENGRLNFAWEDRGGTEDDDKDNNDDTDGERNC